MEDEDWTYIYYLFVEGSRGDRQFLIKPRPPSLRLFSPRRILRLQHLSLLPRLRPSRAAAGHRLTGLAISPST